MFIYKFAPLSPFCKDGEGDTVKKKSLKKNLARKLDTVFPSPPLQKGERGGTVTIFWDNFF